MINSPVPKPPYTSAKLPLTIVKIGGSVIDDAERLTRFVSYFEHVKGAKILVHGGGILATQLAEQLGIQQQMVDGRRITDAETLKIVTMVYAGFINKTIVAKLQSVHCNSIGICGADASGIVAHKRTGTATNYGFVGDIDSVDAAFFDRLLSQNLTPVIAPITADTSGQLLNTNADTVAREVAVALSDMYVTTLVFCFDKPGVLRNPNDGASVISVLDYHTYTNRTHNAKTDLPLLISAGMIPKLDNGFHALREGVACVRIGNADSLNDVLCGRSGTELVYDGQ